VSVHFRTHALPHWLSWLWQLFVSATLGIWAFQTVL
jgi:hypothetical protein